MFTMYINCGCTTGRCVAYCVVVAPMQMNVIPTTVGPPTGTAKKKEKGKKGKKQPLTKNDIGAPTNFQFVLAAVFITNYNRNTIML